MMLLCLSEHALLFLFFYLLHLNAVLSAAMAPNRQSDISSCGLRALIAGSVACFMTACIAGNPYFNILQTAQFKLVILNYDHLGVIALSFCIHFIVLLGY